MATNHRLNLPGAPLKVQIASKAAWNRLRSPAHANFFTFGYSGRKTLEIVEALREHGVRTVVDVRQNAISMYRPELSKRNLRELLAIHGIQYAHAPEYGVPREIRAKAVESGTRDTIWEWYDAQVVPSGEALRKFVRQFEQPVALMCTEIDPCECHRHRLSVALESVGLRGFDL